MRRSLDYIRPFERFKHAVSSFRTWLILVLLVSLSLVIASPRTAKQLAYPVLLSVGLGRVVPGNYALGVPVHKFALLRKGMSKSEVESLLGEPCIRSYREGAVEEVWMYAWPSGEEAIVPFVSFDGTGEVCGIEYDLY